MKEDKQKRDRVSAQEYAAHWGKSRSWALLIANNHNKFNAPLPHDVKSIEKFGNSYVFFLTKQVEV